MTLNPPAHICGEFTSSVPSSIRRERYEWIIAAKDAGHSLSEISAALGLWRFAAGLGMGFFREWLRRYCRLLAAKRERMLVYLFITNWFFRPSESVQTACCFSW